MIYLRKGGNNVEDKYVNECFFFPHPKAETKKSIKIKHSTCDRTLEPYDYHQIGGACMHGVLTYIHTYIHTYTCNSHTYTMHAARNVVTCMQYTRTNYMCAYGSDMSIIMGVYEWIGYING